MTQQIETHEQRQRRRATAVGTVDFMMMYVAHDAFDRDLTRLLRAAETDRGLSPEAQATWRLFSRQRACGTASIFYWFPLSPPLTR